MTDIWIRQALHTIRTAKMNQTAHSEVINQPFQATPLLQRFRKKQRMKHTVPETWQWHWIIFRKVPRQNWKRALRPGHWKREVSPLRTEPCSQGCSITEFCWPQQKAEKKCIICSWRRMMSDQKNTALFQCLVQEWLLIQRSLTEQKKVPGSSWMKKDRKPGRQDLTVRWRITGYM